MKKLTIIMLLATISATSTTAQGNKKSEHVKKEHTYDASKKIAHINQQLKLNATDSALFFPVYLSMKDELKLNRKNFRADNPNKKVNEMSDEEVKKVIDNGFQMRQKDLDIRKAYNEKFIALIGAKKVAELYHIERHGGHQHHQNKSAKPQTMPSKNESHPLKHQQKLENK